MKPQPPHKLLDQLTDVIRTKHYPYRTDQTCKERVKGNILFHNPGLSRGEVKRHLKPMVTEEIQALITTSPPPPRLPAEAKRSPPSSASYPKDLSLS